MLTVLCPMPRFAEWDAAGRPLAGGKLYTAQPGTVAGPGQSFPKSTYTNSTGQTANPNPVILDASGRAPVWLNGAYSVLLTDADDVTIYTADPVSGSGGTASAGSVTQVFGDATDATYNANILSADDPLAPQYYEIFKTDATANVVRITPATGTVRGQASLDIDVQGVGCRITKNPADNNWY